MSSSIFRGAASRSFLTASACVSFALLTGCAWSNPHGSQSLEPVHRLVTEPRDATVHLERLNRTYRAPCDFPMDVYESDVVRITKEGFLPFEGPLGSLPEVARGTRKCLLAKR